MKRILGRGSVMALALVGVAFASTTAAAQVVSMSVDVDRGALYASSPQKAYLRVKLEAGHGTSEHRAPLNLSLVIDRSSSMSGVKMEQAKTAAKAAVEMLGPADIVSVVAYDDTVSVVVPATEGSDQRTILAGIDRLFARGSTALFAGTSKGAQEVRKFWRRDRVNRVILLSDGLANVGPSTPGELGALGEALRREGIAVSTVGLGLGYNEDLMVELADRSGGTHAFVENAQQLAQLYRQGIGGLAKIVAQEVVVQAKFNGSFRPVRSLNLTGEVIDRTINGHLAQLYGGAAEEMVIEYECPGLPVSFAPLAEIKVTYYNMASGRTEYLNEKVTVTVTSDASRIDGSVNRDVMERVIELLAVERNEAAIRLRDEGRINAARQALRANQVFLKKNADKLQSETLRVMEVQNKKDEKEMAPKTWKKSRKKRKAMAKKKKKKKYSATYTF